jgi:hypothetical protein
VHCTPEASRPKVDHIDSIRLSGSSINGSFDGAGTWDFPELEELAVYNTALTGGLPAGLRGPRLTNVVFQGNAAMRGPLPHPWGQPDPLQQGRYPLDQVQHLVLAGSEWTGTLPSAAGVAGGAAFGSLHSLKIVGVAGAPGLTGGIPDELAAAFPQLTVRPASRAACLEWPRMCC